MRKAFARLIVEAGVVTRTLVAVGCVAFATAGCTESGFDPAPEPAEPAVTTETSELVCNGSNCTCSSTFGIGFVQGTDGTGTHKNFELAVPHTNGGFSAYFRDNDRSDLVGADTWKGAISAGSGDINGISLLENKVPVGPIPGNGNLEVIVVRDGSLFHYWRDRATKVWSSGTFIASGVTGQPGFVQNDASHKNFEVVVARPQNLGGGLLHFWRNNTAQPFVWTGPTVFATGRTYDAVSLLESDYDVNRLEVVARSGTQLFHVWREGDVNWHTPTQIVPDDGAIIAAGVPSFVQRQVASPAHGNFELLVPLMGGSLRSYFRDNSVLKVPTDPDPFYHWFTRPSAVDENRSYSAAAVTFADYGNPINAVGRRSDDGSLAAFFFDDTNQIWQAKGNDINGNPLWSGAVFGGEPCCDPATKGLWQNPYNSGAIGIHAALLKTGKVLFFGFGDNKHEGYSEIFDPTNGTSVLPSGDMPHAFCAGHAFLSDGQLWVAGGHEEHVAESHVFNPDTSAWTMLADMGTEAEGAGRWYPTLTRLPDGSVFAISGAQHANRLGVDGNQVNNTYQIMGTDLSLGGRIPTGTTFAGDTLKLYPFVFQLPSGQLFVHSYRTSRLLTLAGQQWSQEYTTQYAFSRNYPGSGSAVLLPLSPADNYRARIMLFGGGGDVNNNGPKDPIDAGRPATNTVEVLDLGASSPQWTSRASMNFQRVLATAVLLPDGKVFVVGGSSHGSSDTAPNPVMTPEIYDPIANNWSTMCPMRVARLYHSTAILLPDARVLTAGRDHAFNMAPYQWPERRVEIFTPPYLQSNQPRPAIQTVSPSVTLGYNASFSVALSNAVSAANISRVVLMSPGAVTHAFDMGQRAITLTFSGGAGNTIQATTPLNSMVAPPGYYMLFVVSNAGVPSVATFVKLG